MRTQLKKWMPRSLLLLALLTALTTSLAGMLWAKPSCVYTGTDGGFCVLRHGKCVVAFGAGTCTKVK